MCSKRISPFVTTSGLASGASTTVRSRAIVSSPSCTTPTFSNRPATSHMIQCDMPCRRMTRPTEKAMAPVSTALIVHSQIEVAATENNRNALRMFKAIVSSVTSRNWRCTVSRNTPMLACA